LTTVSLNTLLQSRWKACRNTSQNFVEDPLNTLQKSLFEAISIGRTNSLYLAFDVPPKELVCYCKIRRTAGQVMSAKRETCVYELAWISVLCEQLLLRGDRQYGSAAQRASWFSNFKYGQVFPAYKVLPLA
jgi:hypothetical protein